MLLAAQKICGRGCGERAYGPGNSGQIQDTGQLGIGHPKTQAQARHAKGLGQRPHDEQKLSVRRMGRHALFRLGKLNEGLIHQQKGL